MMWYVLESDKPFQDIIELHKKIITIELYTYMYTIELYKSHANSNLNTTLQ